MKANALLMDERDNVATCVTEIKAGEAAVYQDQTELKTVTAEETIPYCHKIALQDIPEGAEVRKYGEVIGYATEYISRGYWVSDKNLVCLERDYESEMLPTEDAARTSGIANAGSNTANAETGTANVAAGGSDRMADRILAGLPVRRDQCH